VASSLNSADRLPEVGRVGRSDPQIALILGLSPNTVHSHIEAAKTKMHANSRSTGVTLGDGRHPSVRPVRIGTRGRSDVRGRSRACAVRIISQAKIQRPTEKSEKAPRKRIGRGIGGKLPGFGSSSRRANPEYELPPRS